MYLHPADPPDWYEKYGFSSPVEAYRYFLKEKEVIGTDVGWNLNENCEFETWAEPRISSYRQFYFEIKKGDIVLVNKKFGNTWVQAILEVLEDKVYMHDRPMPACDSFKGEEAQKYEECLRLGDRISITRCLWDRWGIAKAEEIHFEKYPEDPKLWFQMLKKVKVLWYEESDRSAFNYSVQKTLAKINKPEVIKTIEEKVGGVKNADPFGLKG